MGRFVLGGVQDRFGGRRNGAINCTVRLLVGLCLVISPAWGEEAPVEVEAPVFETSPAEVDVVEPAVEMEAEPVVEAEAEVETEPVVEAEAEVEAEPVVEAEAEVDAEPVVEAELPEVEEAAIESLVRGGLDAPGRIDLKSNQIRVLRTHEEYSRVSVGQPEVLEVNAITPTSLLLTARRAGRTQLILWDEQEDYEVIDVTVRFDVQGLEERIGTIFPGVCMEIGEVGGTVVLRGQVSDLEVAEQIAAVAAPYAEEVLNFLEVAGGQQVMLQVRFAEVSRSASTALGVNAAFATGSWVGGSNIGQINPTNFLPEGGPVGTRPRPDGFVLDERTVSPAVTLYGAGQAGTFYLEYFIQALRQNSLLRILAEPNLITISGQEASFLAGGEFPIPVAQSGQAAGSVSVEFREFGVRLSFVPVVLGDGRIRMKVRPEVSDLDFTSGVQFGGFVIPGLTQRRVETTIELADGQTFAIAGLLNQNLTAVKEVTPLLGDLPIIGALFRSVRYQRCETELVVLVTPRLVGPMNPDRIPLLPGEVWRHPTERQLFLHQDLGGPLGTVSGEHEPAVYYGRYGFQPPEHRP